MRRRIAISRALTLIVSASWLVVRLASDRLLAKFNERAARQVTAKVERRLALWARNTAREIGMKIHVEGEIPEGPVAIVSNHLSYIDIVALWALLPGVFVARADVANWPLIGIAGRLIDTIFIERSRKRDLLRVLPEMEAALASGRNVIFFPEGTSSRGEGVLPFKSSLFEAAVRQRVPVVTASLQFETAAPSPSADSAVAWWADMTFLPHVFALLHLPGFDARVRFSRPIQILTGGNALTSHPLDLSEKRAYGKARTSPIRDLSDGKIFPVTFTPTPRLIRQPKERKELCHLAYEAVDKKFIPTTPTTSTTSKTPAIAVPASAESPRLEASRPTSPQSNLGTRPTVVGANIRRSAMERPK